VAVKIKLMRLGKMRAPYYRIVVADARTKREGRVIETIGKYHPKENPSFIEVDGERAAYWLGVGAQPTEPVAAILKVTGDWQAFKGLPAPPPMLVAEPKADKKAVFEAPPARAPRPVAPPPRRRRRPLPRRSPTTTRPRPATPRRPPRRPRTRAAEGEAPAVAETTVPADACRPTRCRRRRCCRCAGRRRRRPRR
jgi:small subunit ribosomal protein S16